MTMMMMMMMMMVMMMAMMFLVTLSYILTTILESPSRCIVYNLHDLCGLTIIVAA